MEAPITDKKTIEVIYFNRRVPPKGFKFYKKVYYEAWNMTAYFYRKTLTDKKEIEMYEKLVNSKNKLLNNYMFVDDERALN